MWCVSVGVCVCVAAEGSCCTVAAARPGPHRPWALPVSLCGGHADDDNSSEARCMQIMGHNNRRLTSTHQPKSSS